MNRDLILEKAKENNELIRFHQKKLDKMVGINAPLDYLQHSLKIAQYNGANEAYREILQMIDKS